MSKCKICSKKIKSIFKDMYTCKCDGVYCSNHLHDHSCTYDMKAFHRKCLEKRLIKVKKSKIQPI